MNRYQAFAADLKQRVEQYGYNSQELHNHLVSQPLEILVEGFYQFLLDYQRSRPLTLVSMQCLFALTDVLQQYFNVCTYVFVFSEAIDYTTGSFRSADRRNFSDQKRCLASLFAYLQGFSPLFAYVATRPYRYLYWGAYDLSVLASSVVFDCDEATNSFLSRIGCAYGSILWASIFPNRRIPSVFQELTFALAALGRKAGILNEDLLPQGILTRSQGERSWLLWFPGEISENVTQGLPSTREELNYFVNVLDNVNISNDWEDSVRYILENPPANEEPIEVEVYSASEDIESVSEDIESEWENADNISEVSIRRPGEGEGLLDVAVYRDFFDVWCLATSEVPLRTVKRIFTSLFDRREFTNIETKEEFCNWLRTKQVERANECVDTFEPFTMDEIAQIPLLFLYQHITRDGVKHCFNIIYLRKHLFTSDTNPNNRIPFTQSEKDDIIERYDAIATNMYRVLDLTSTSPN